MKVFVAGATGAMGRQLVPRLVAGGHEVVGTTRSESKRTAIEEMGARAVVVDALDADRVGGAVAKAEPEVIIYELTAIGALDIRNFDRAFAPTNRLRTEGTDHLLAAGRAVGVKRFLAQSYAAWPYARTGGQVKTEEDPLDPTPARKMRESLQAIRHLEIAVTSAEWTEGIVLRYGGFYGPGTSVYPGGEQWEQVRERKFPMVGDGAGIWSFVHIADAAEATAIAVDRGARGIYNIVDDDPAPVAAWLPALAETAGAPKPWRVPKFIARVAAGEVGVDPSGDRRAAIGAPRRDGRLAVMAIARSLHGRSRVARTLLNWVKLGRRIPAAAIRPAEVNGGPGALLLDGDGRLIAVWALEIGDGLIQSVSSIINPEKLAHLGPVADLAVLLRRAAGD